jgi:hypothetical protein
MQFPTIPLPWESDQFIMDIIFSHPLDSTKIARLNRCRVYLHALFLSDIMIADRKYLEHFVFDPSGITKQS